MKEVDIDEKHKILLEIMLDIDRFCRENNVLYTISAGTMLGAVRHGGFIPWDDDADLFMLREDFDRFLKIYRSDRFHLLHKTDSKDEYMASGFIKISDPETFVDSRRTRSKFGVSVDIFPLDAVPVNPKEQREFMHKVMSAHNRLHHRQLRDIVSIIKSYRHSTQWWWDRVYQLTHSGRYDDSPMVAQVIGTDNYRTILDKKCFDNLIDYDFEGHKFLGIANAHEYLTMLYGADYMTPKKWAHSYKIYRQ